MRERLIPVPMTVYRCKFDVGGYCKFPLVNGQPPSASENSWITSDNGALWCRQHHSSPDPENIECDKKQLVGTQIVAQMTEDGMLT